MKRICFLCANSLVLNKGPFAGLPCPNPVHRRGEEE
jgi:hypothetical protein